MVEEELTQAPAKGSDNGILVVTDTDGSIWMSFARWSIWVSVPVRVHKTAKPL